MSPIVSQGECPLLTKDDTFYFCNDYENRPEQCRNHKFEGFKICPVGIEKLGLTGPIHISIRIDEGWRKYNLKKS